MKRGIRIAAALLMAAAGLISAVAAPASAAKPTRTVIECAPPPDDPCQPEGNVIDAGLGCSFDVQIQPSENAREAITEFSDGRVQTIGHAEPTLVNLETGDSFHQRSRYKITEIYDPVANEIVVEISGRFFVQFFPGDQGLSGLVEEPGALLSVIGHQRFTVDPDTFAYTSYSLNGRVVTDICAALSG
jgi:hypothetical protein